MTEIADLRARAGRLLDRHRAARVRVRDEAKALETLRDGLAAATEARSVLQTVAQAVQTKAHDQIATVVTHCLQTVFPGRGYSFAVAFDRKRGRTEARMSFVKDGHDVDPTEEDSGGVTAVAAFGLRVACLLLTTPKRRRLLLLDEPFGFVSAEYLPNVAVLLQSLAEKMGMQVILVTHSPELRVGKVVEL